MDKDKRLQNILLLYPIIFVTCAFTWHLIYWSTFDANVIQLLSINQMILSFIDSFSKFFYIYLMNFVLIFFVFGFEISLSNTKKLETDAKYRTRMNVISKLLVIVPVVGCILVFEFYDSINKWLVIVIPMVVALYTFIIDSEFLQDTFTSTKQRRLILMTLVTLFAYTICIARYNSLRILNNIEYDIVKLCPNQTDNKTATEYKLLGFASDYIVVSDLANKEIILYNKSSVNILTITKYKNK
jgi:hypothetical protein